MEESKPETQKPPKKEKFKELSAEELKEKWADNETYFPKVPFGLINFYQFMLPMLILILFDFGLYKLSITWSISTWEIILVLPLLALFNWVGYIWLMVQLSRILEHKFNQISPSETGTFARHVSKSEGVDPKINAYHLRGFLYKLPVFLAKKSCFPWMVNFVLRRLSGNKIHKNFIYGDSFVGLEFTDMADGAVVMDGVTVSTHVVDSIYGNLSIFPITFGENAVAHSNAVMAPGSGINANEALAPRAFAVKKWYNKNPDNIFYWGAPPRKGRTQDLEDLLPEDLRKKWEDKKNTL